MNTIIDKELLSLVLNTDVGEIKPDIYQHIGVYGSFQELEYLNVELEMNEWFTVNLDTLGRLCKEWCLNKGYHLVEYVNGVEITERAGCKKIKTIQNAKDFSVETVIKSTEWVANKEGMLK